MKPVSQRTGNSSDHLLPSSFSLSAVSSLSLFLSLCRCSSPLTPFNFLFSRRYLSPVLATPTSPSSSFSSSSSSTSSSFPPLSSHFLFFSFFRGGFFPFSFCPLRAFILAFGRAVEKKKRAGCNSRSLPYRQRSPASPPPASSSFSLRRFPVPLF